MAPQLVNSNIADSLLSALCNTLLHSLWQGIILAAIAGIIVISTRKATSALRYNLLVSALLLFTLGVVGTFVWQYERIEGPGAAFSPVQHTNVYTRHVNVPHVNEPYVNVQPVHIFINGKPQSLPGFGERWGNFLADHHNTIVFIWFLIVCARSLQLAFGLYGTYRLRKVRVFAVDNQWNRRLQQLADSLGIKQAVRLLESGIAKVPMVIGHLKPVILVPVGLLTALSAEEVEAILIHELAHIKRRDYLVNMLQSLVEIVLFFNPAVLWVSRLIKTERENCCDDLALAQNNNKINYIRALVSCEEYQASVPAYAMGLPGSKNTLLRRVKRLVSDRNYSLNLFEKTVLAICLVVLGLGVSAFTAREDIKKVLNKVATSIHHDKAQVKERANLSLRDTTKKKHATHLNDANILLNDNNASVLLNKLQLLHPDTLRLNNVNGLNLINHNLDSLLKLNGKQSALMLNGLNGKLLALNNDNANNALLQLRKADTNQVNLLKGNLLLLQGKSDNNPLKLMEMNPAAFRTFNNIGRELYREHLITDTNHLGISLDEHKLIVNGKTMPKDLHDRIYKKYGREGENGSYSSNYTDNNARFADDDKTNNIISDMIKDGIITSADDLSFKIGTTEFVVNYKKQPDALYQKYKAKYVPAHKKGDWIWFYKFDTQKWDHMTGRKNSSDFDGTATGVFQGKEDGNSGGYKTGYSGGYNDRDYYNPEAYTKQTGEERQRLRDARDKKLVADLLKDGLITDPKNVTFTITDKSVTVNGKPQSDEIYKKYKDKYMPDNSGSDWNWTYSHHE